MNFNRSASVRGTPLLDALSCSLRSALNCSAGVGGLSWLLPSAAATDRASIRTRAPFASRCMCVSPRSAAEQDSSPAAAGRRAGPPVLNMQDPQLLGVLAALGSTVQAHRHVRG